MQSRTIDVCFQKKTKLSQRTLELAKASAGYSPLSDYFQVSDSEDIAHNVGGLRMANINMQTPVRISDRFVHLCLRQMYMQNIVIVRQHWKRATRKIMR